MNKLRIMSSKGHEELVWDPEAVEAEDPEALAVVAEAERIVAEAIARGQMVFKVEAPGHPAEQVEQFDRTAKQTIVIPRVAGG